MKVKIGNKVYDSNEVPILLVLSDEDKANIAGMLTDKHKICSYPESMDEEKVQAWMKDVQ